MSMGLVLMSKLMAMMVMVVVGYAAVKLHVVESKDSLTLSRLTVYILQPCLICRSVQIDLTPERLSGFLCALILGIVTYLFWIAALGLLKRPLRLDAVDRCNLIYSNVGNLALGNSIISGERHLHFRKIIFNPNIIALVTGVLLVLLHIRIPDVIDTAMEGLGGMVGPCSMLVIGIVITKSDLRKIVTDVRAYGIALGRLIVMPASLLLLILASGILTRHPELTPVFQVCFIALCTPPGATVSQLAVLYDKKAYESSVYSVLSMALCIVTMPLMLGGRFSVPRANSIPALSNGGIEIASKICYTDCIYHFSRFVW